MHKLILKTLWQKAAVRGLFYKVKLFTGPHCVHAQCDLNDTMHLFQEIEKLKALQEQVEVTKLHCSRRCTLFLVKSIRSHNNFMKAKHPRKWFLKEFLFFTERAPESGFVPRHRES